MRKSIETESYHLNIFHLRGSQPLICKTHGLIFKFEFIALNIRIYTVRELKDMLPQVSEGIS